MRRSIDDLGPGVDVVPLENWMVTVLDRSERFQPPLPGHTRNREQVGARTWPSILQFRLSNAI